jgi:glutamate carboxypeptidase
MEGAHSHDIRTWYRTRHERYLDILRQMVNMNSWTRNPDGIARLSALTAENFFKAGFSSEVIPHPAPEMGSHLLMERNPEGDVSIALISHLDTVYSPEEEQKNSFSWKKEGNRIFGPGTADIKGGTLVALMAMEGLARWFPDLHEKLHVQVFLNSAEEENSDHFGDLLNERLSPLCSAVLVCEAGRMIDGSHALVTSRKGRRHIRLRSRGKSAHSGQAHDQGENAIIRLARILPGLAELTDYELGRTVNTGLIQGGEGLNRVPLEARAEVEIRARKMKDMEEVDNYLTQQVEAFPEGNVSYDHIRSLAPWEKNRGTNDLFKSFRKAADIQGISLVEESRGGLSDGNLIWQRIPTIDGIGPVGFNAHCSGGGGEEQEFILEDSLQEKAQLTLFFLETWFSGKNQG